MNILKKLFWILIILLGILIALLVLLNVLFITYTSIQEYKPLMRKKFNKDIWITAQGDTLERRCGMYHDLTRNHLKKGMSIKEVENLVGEINDWGYCTDKKTKCSMHLMGVCYSNALSIVNMVLYICFDRNHRLVTYARERPCNMQGWYTPKTKEQYCSKTDSQGFSLPTNDCGITDPW